jgi:hypothetical protein
VFNAAKAWWEGETEAAAVYVADDISTSAASSPRWDTSGTASTSPRRSAFGNRVEG